MENKPASLLAVPLGKALSGIPHLGVVDRWLVTSGDSSFLWLLGLDINSVKKNGEKSNKIATYTTVKLLQNTFIHT